MTRHPMSQEFDPRLADWLEDDPDDAPGAVLETVLAAFPSIPQRRASRVPWRNRPMTQTTRLLAGAAAIAVVLLGGLFLLRPGAMTGPGAQSPSVPPSAPAASISGSPGASAPATLAETFTSTRYGYTVGYPTGWTTTPATKTWTALLQNTWGSGYNDELKGTDIRFSGTSIALAKDQTAEQWLTAYAAGGDVASWPTVTIDGAVGRIDYDGGPASGGTIAPGGRMFDAVLVSGAYAYNFNMDGHVDRATFESFLASVKLPVIPRFNRTFTSTIAGYSVSYPGNWIVTPATKVWKTGFDATDPALSDRMGSNPSFAGTSTKLPAGTSFETWYAGYDAARAKGTCIAAALEESVTVDGTVGRLDLHCPTFYLEAVVSTGGRAYVLTMYAPVTRPFFQAVLDSVRLTPATAKN